MYGAIHHAGASRIQDSVLDIRNFRDRKFNGSALYAFTGKPDAVYFADLQEFVKEKAGANSSIMQSAHFVYMQQNLLDKLRNLLTTIQNSVAPTEKQLELAMKISDSLRKTEEVQQQNNDKARVCLEILSECVSQSVLVKVKPILLRFPGQEEVQLKEVLDHLKVTYPITAYEIKAALDFDVTQIGIASTQDTMQTLLVALQMQQLRQHMSLTTDNPNVLLQREGLRANNVAIQAHALQIAGYAAANAALAPGVHPPLIPDLVLPFTVPQADYALGGHNVQCNWYQGGVDDGDNPIPPPVFAYPIGMVLADPPLRCLIDPTVLEKTDLDWLNELRNKTESNTTSIVMPLRAIVINALTRVPIPTLADIAQEITQHIAINPQSNNHTTVALHSALAKQYGLSGGPTGGFAHAAHEGEPGGSSHVAYGAYEVTKNQAESLTNEELGQKRRAELLVAPAYGQSCHFWGHQQGGLVCGKETATGRACDFAAFHNANHLGPPYKQYGPPGMGGQRL